MSKSGLHKQVSSIFDGVPRPDNPSARSGSVLRRLMDDEPSAAPSSSPSAPTAQSQTPPSAPCASRPKPVPKAACTTEPSWLKTAVRSLTKTKKRDDSHATERRQKVMIMLVAVLSVVFVATLTVTLGGIGGATSNTTQTDPDQEIEPSAKTPKPIDPDTWTFPEPLPATMRDPLVMPEPAIILTGSESTEAVPQWTVQGIVYSSEKPSAIINEQVVLVGQFVNGAKIVRISPRLVEFEKDGQRWTQSVQ